MVRALGYSENPFDVRDPGRLCRGRERWIDPYDPPTPPDALVRTVISGAAFTDDTAADAHRSADASGIAVADLLEALVPGRRLLAFMEDGHPADIPDSAQGVEAYEGFRSGGRTELGLVRWTAVAKGRDQVVELLGDAPDERIRGFAVLPARGEVDEDALRDSLFLLVGFSTLDSPPARYQPMALPEILEKVDAVILLHRDKHGPAVAFYSRAPLPDLAARLERLVTEHPGVLLVPFAIPPMLARWDRAIHELRAQWSDGEFPVPRGVPQRDGRRGRRRWRSDDDDALVPPIADEPPPSLLDAAEE